MALGRVVELGVLGLVGGGGGRQQQEEVGRSVHVLVAVPVPGLPTGQVIP